MHSHLNGFLRFHYHYNVNRTNLNITVIYSFIRYIVTYVNARMVIDTTASCILRILEIINTYIDSARNIHGNKYTK